LQILLHFLLPPPPTALSPSALPKKRGRKGRPATPNNEQGAFDLAQSLMAYAERLSIWQALATLGVDVLSLTGGGGGETSKGKEHAGPSSAGAAKPKIDWVGAFYIDVIEPTFGLSHPGFCHILSSTLQIPSLNVRSIKATPLRPEVDSQRPQPTPPMPVVWPPPGVAAGASGLPSASSRRKGKAKQLPDDANRYVLAAANAVGTGGAGSRPAGSMARTTSTGDGRALARSTSSSATAANARPGLLAPGRKSSSSTTTAATILERAASLGAPTALKPSRSNSLGPSAAAAAGNGAGSTSSRFNSFARAGSHGPGSESQTEKLMRRSVSFTKGAGVGRKSAGGPVASASGDSASGGGGKGEQMKLDGLWGARVSRVGGPTASDDKGAGFGKPTRRESLQRPKSFGPSTSLAALTILPKRPPDVA
jgi:hypothetical protein